MNIYLSKVILSGIIASSFMTMSCQKRGTRPSAKLVGGVEKTVQQDQQLPAGNLPDISIPEQKDTTVPEVTAEEKTAPTPEVKVEDKKETPKVADKKEETSKEDDEEEVLTPVVVKKQEEVVVAKEEKKEEAEVASKTDEKTCSDATINKSQELTDKYTDLSGLITSKADESKVKESLESVIVLCREYVALIKKYAYNTCDFKNAAGKEDKLNWVKHKEECLYSGKRLKTAGVKNEFGDQYDKQAAEQIKALKAATFSVQQSALELFSAEGTEWKKFTSKGAIQSDSRTLMGSADTACTVIGKGTKLLADNSVSLKVLSVTDKTIKLDKAVAGVSLKTTVRSQVSGAAADAGTDFAVEIQCTNASVEHFKINSIKGAFGKALVEAKK